MLYPLRRGQVKQAPAGGGEGRVFAVERSIREGEVEVGLYPCREVPGREQVRFLVLPVLAPALLIGGGLHVLRETGEQVGVGRGDEFSAERLRNCRDQLQQRQTSIDVGCALAGFVDQRGHVIAGHVEQTLEALRLFVGVNVDPLAVLDQLPFKGLRIVNIDDPGGKGEELGELRGAEAPCPCDDLESFGVGPYCDGLDEAVRADALGKLLQFGFIEGAARVGGGLVDGVDGDVLEFAAVLHVLALLGAFR